MNPITYLDIIIDDSSSNEFMLCKLKNSSQSTSPSNSKESIIDISNTSSSIKQTKWTKRLKTGQSILKPNASNNKSHSTCKSNYKNTILNVRNKKRNLPSADCPDNCSLVSQNHLVGCQTYLERNWRNMKVIVVLNRIVKCQIMLKRINLLLI